MPKDQLGGRERDMGNGKISDLDSLIMQQKLTKVAFDEA
jgi:hypothetical protein